MCLQYEDVCDIIFEILKLSVYSRIFIPVVFCVNYSKKNFIKTLKVLCYNILLEFPAYIYEIGERKEYDSILG